MTSVKSILIFITLAVLNIVVNDVPGKFTILILNTTQNIQII